MCKKTHHIFNMLLIAVQSFKMNAWKSWEQLITQSNYRIVLKYWDTQRIGTSLKIVKIIILADPKYWTILRKRKNIRNFSDPKNWDGVFGAPKWSKTCLTLLVYKRCPHVLSPSRQKRHRHCGFQCSSASRNILKWNTCLLICLNVYVLHKIGPGTSDCNVHVQ